MTKKNVEVEYIYWSLERGIIDRELQRKELPLRVNDYVKLEGTFLGHYYKIDDIKKVYDTSKEILRVILYLTKDENHPFDDIF